MEIGLQSMTEKKTTNSPLNVSKELSIQVSLSGLSFFEKDLILNELISSAHFPFEKNKNPYELLDFLKNQLRTSGLDQMSFEKISIIHKNNLFSLVPKTLFDPNQLANYLKFNAKLLMNDELVYDELVRQEIFFIYVPFTNINNYLYDLYGGFEFNHFGYYFLNFLFKSPNTKSRCCYCYIDEAGLCVAVIENNKLQLYNQFEYHNPADFLYYLLFTYEQLNLDTLKTPLKLLGCIEQDHELMHLIKQYIKDVSILEVSAAAYYFLTNPTPIQKQL